MTLRELIKGVLIRLQYINIIIIFTIIIIILYEATRYMLFMILKG